jgi:hypothetical protein
VNKGRYVSLLPKPIVRNNLVFFRYEKLSEYLHVNGTVNPARGQQGHDPIHKIRPVFEMALRNFQGHYDPHRDLSVDEAMVSFKGRLAFKQYMPAKPTKWGIKVWELADSHNGFVLNMQVYTGKAGVQGPGLQDAGREDVGLGHRVVEYLTRPYHRLNHHIYMLITSSTLSTWQRTWKRRVHIYVVQYV